jgi:2-polyprenyl-3-methyl-5-hydroxy-6-metoxy-1,4-benzoquinol methylase
MKRVRDLLVPQRPLRHSLSISPDASPEEALAKMREQGVARLTVAENGVNLGIVQRIDVEIHRERTALEEERRKLGAISKQDEMYKRSDDWAMQAHHDDAYYREGLRVIDHIRAAMQAIEKDRLHTILDLPCGHGRILRTLKAAFPEAKLTACDIDRDGVDFCASEFGAKPVYSVEDPANITIEGQFDLIYCGSLLTHLDRDKWIGFLDLFSHLLAPKGILIFTTESYFHAEMTAKNGDPLDILEEFSQTGFAYRDHPGGKGYGQSLSSPAWVCAFLEQWPTLELVSLQVKGLDQDVYACTKRAF